MMAKLIALIFIGAMIAGGVAILAGIELAEYRVAVRSHNLDVFYKAQTCGDLPLMDGLDVTACEQAIGKFMVPEDGLFTR